MASSGGGIWSLKGSSRYVTVQAPNKGSLATVNIFLVTKSIRACATVEDIRKNFKAGTYTVRVPNEAQAKQLKDKLTVLGDQITKVEVVDDEFRNTSRAVISCRDLIGVTEEQIVEELSEQGIKAARHLKKARKLLESRTNAGNYAKVAAAGSMNTAEQVNIEEEKNKWLSEIKKKEESLKVSMQIEYLTKELENKQHYITLLEQKVKTLTSNKMTPNEERRPMPTKRDRSSEAKKNDELDSDDSNRSRSPAPKTLAIETTTTSKDDLISLSETIYVEVESSSSMEFDPNSISPNS
ncbi:conserved hypothetical protein [Culex quinquefasciatus]|uniref:Uncharacterized protein n=1 Tax=Culex quinquefasciatus TaxID=7176 RepID=B0WC34_CULQU|nr:conserved hypothetical protein [Culex quinquefasciatus]|eukprot:XP_001846268.1 conserved hypothetical protein [Culex quinquefasciatus]